MIYYFKIKLQSKQIKLIMHQVYFKCISNAIKSEYILVDLEPHLTFSIDLDFIRYFLNLMFNRKLK